METKNFMKENSILVFNTNKYENILQELNAQRKKISEEETIVFQDWHKALNNFFKNVKTGFVCVNETFYIKIENIETGIMDHLLDNATPIQWYKLYGLRITPCRRTIYTCFSECYKIKINDTIRECDENEFKNKLNEVSKIVFNNTPENFNLQFKSYTSSFYNNILFKYKEYFDDSIVDFVKKLENKSIRTTD